MSKQKQFPKPTKTSKKAQPPETEDEYLAAGVKEEEGGEKWRAGDAAKSLRFFLRAIDIYDTGLRKHTSSFDLAYNKARLQYDVSQQPRLLAHQTQPVVELLFATLESHQHALRLGAEDADALFNTAQVMVSISEALADLSTPVGTHDRNDAVPLLREAIKLFRNCYTVQNKQYEEVQAAMSTESLSTPPPPPSSLPPDLTEPEAEETWASVKETITTSTLLDTILAEIHAWTLLLPQSISSTSLFSETAVNVADILKQASTLVHSPAEQQIYEQAHFNLEASLAESGYRNGALGASDYASALENSWNACATLTTFGPALCDHADALIALNTALASDISTDTPLIRWKALALALRSLATADKDPGPVERSTINARRGDVELLRVRLGESPVSYEQAAKSRAVLLKNAETYYAGAGKLAALSEDTASDADTLTAKHFIAKGLGEGNLESLLAGLSASDQARIHAVVSEMVEEGLLPP